MFKLDQTGTPKLTKWVHPNYIGFTFYLCLFQSQSLSKFLQYSDRNFYLLPLCTVPYIRRKSSTCSDSSSKRDLKGLPRVRTTVELKRVTLDKTWRLKVWHSYLETTKFNDSHRLYSCTCVCAYVYVHLYLYLYLRMALTVKIRSWCHK